jgi:hypothetical protein
MQTTADVIARLRANWCGYLREYRILLVLLGVAALADMLSTIYFMLIDGPGAERHPVIRAVSIVLGPVLGPIVGKLCQIATVLVVTVYLRRLALYILVAVIILYAWAAWYNIVATPVLLGSP